MDHKLSIKTSPSTHIDIKLKYLIYITFNNSTKLNNINILNKSDSNLQIPIISFY